MKKPSTMLVLKDKSMSTNAKNMIPHLDEALIDLLNGTLPTLH